VWNVEQSVIQNNNTTIIMDRPVGRRLANLVDFIRAGGANMATTATFCMTLSFSTALSGKSSSGVE